MANRKRNIQKELEKWLLNDKRVVVAGIGNSLRMDDYLGVKIVQALQGRVSERVSLIECETVPESFLQQIMDFDPTHVLLIDAAVLGLKPGELRLVNPEQLVIYPAFTTHMLPLRIFCEYLSKTTKAKIALLLVEPEKTDFGEGLTRKINAVAQQIVSILLRVLP